MYTLPSAIATAVQTNRGDLIRTICIPTEDNQNYKEILRLLADLLDDRHKLLQDIEQLEAYISNIHGTASRSLEFINNCRDHINGINDGE